MLFVQFFLKRPTCWQEVESHDAVFGNAGKGHGFVFLGLSLSNRSVRVDCFKKVKGIFCESFFAKGTKNQGFFSGFSGGCFDEVDHPRFGAVFICLLQQGTRLNLLLIG